MKTATETYKIVYLRENVPNMSSPLPFSAGSQLVLGGVYDEGVAENPKMSPRSPVVDCETGAAAPPVAPTSPPSCIKICSTHQLQD